jgi:hypothetical protein
VGYFPAAARTDARNAVKPSITMPLSATPSHLGFTRRLLELLHLLVVIVDERLLYFNRGI